MKVNPRPVADNQDNVPNVLANDALITQAQLKHLTGNVSNMTIWRWRQDGLIPEPTKIRGRNYWHCKDVHTLLNQLMKGDSPR